VAPTTTKSAGTTCAVCTNWVTVHRAHLVRLQVPARCRSGPSGEKASITRGNQGSLSLRAGPASGRRAGFVDEGSSTTSKCSVWFHCFNSAQCGSIVSARQRMDELRYLRLDSPWVRRHRSRILVRTAHVISCSQPRSRKNFFAEHCHLLREGWRIIPWQEIRPFGAES
jgi:hypothetical protein